MYVYCVYTAMSYMQQKKIRINFFFFKCENIVHILTFLLGVYRLVRVRQVSIVLRST
jgi:hypothetical protein